MSGSCTGSLPFIGLNGKPATLSLGVTQRLDVVRLFKAVDKARIPLGSSVQRLLMGDSIHLSFDLTGALRALSFLWLHVTPKDAYRVNALGSVPIISLVYCEVSAWRKVTFGC